MVGFRLFGRVVVMHPEQKEDVAKPFKKRPAFMIGLGPQKDVAHGAHPAGPGAGQDRVQIIAPAVKMGVAVRADRGKGEGFGRLALFFLAHPYFSRAPWSHFSTGTASSMSMTGISSRTG